MESGIYNKKAIDIKINNTSKYYNQCKQHTLQKYKNVTAYNLSHSIQDVWI